jgi:hypothetical protein
MNYIVSEQGVTATIKAENVRSAQAQLNYVIERYGKKVVTDPTVLSLLDRDYSIKEISND